MGIFRSRDSRKNEREHILGSCDRKNEWENLGHRTVGRMNGKIWVT